MSIPGFTEHEVSWLEGAMHRARSKKGRKIGNDQWEMTLFSTTHQNLGLEKRTSEMQIFLRGGKA